MNWSMAMVSLSSAPSMGWVGPSSPEEISMFSVFANIRDDRKKRHTLLKRDHKRESFWVEDKDLLSFAAAHNVREELEISFISQSISARKIPQDLGTWIQSAYQDDRK